MPELPEVETIARTLRSGVGQEQEQGRIPSLLGRTILEAQVLWHRSVARPSPEEFQQRIAGQRIQTVGRRGKYLTLSLSTDTLLVHLRMSGDLWVEPADVPMGVHHRLVLMLDQGWRLAFNDARKFGRVWLTADPDQVVSGLGPEPLDPGLTEEAFFEMLRGRRRLLKPLLSDQGFLAGLGNIYADEALFEARLHPLTRSDQLTSRQARRLLAAIRSVLEEGIRRNGASIDWVYRGGDYQNHFRVYRRTGEPCYRCGSHIERLIVGQRSTHVCPACQPRTE